MVDFWFGFAVGCLVTIVSIVALICVCAIKRGGKK